MGLRLVGRITGVGGGGETNYRRSVTAGVAASQIATLRAASTTAAAAVSNTLVTLLTPVVAGVAATQSVSGSTQVLVTSSVETDVVLNASGVNLTSSMELVQATWGLVATRGSNAATSTGSNAFTNPTNAQGLANGTLASGAGDALGARSYQLNLAYPAFVNKTELTITAAELQFYISQTGTALNNGGMTIGWSSTSRAYAQTNAFPADVNYLTTPLVVPVTGVPLTWTEMASIVARVNHVTAALNTSTANVDAVHLVVTASRTDSL